MIDPALVAAVNSRAYSALATVRRNAGNTAYEFSRPAWLDTANTFTGAPFVLTTSLFVGADGGNKTCRIDDAATSPYSLHMWSLGMLGWTASSSADAALDTGLIRDAAGAVRVCDGTSAGIGSLLCGAQSAAASGLRVRGTTSQSATLVQLQGQSSLQAREQADLDTAWIDSTDATRKASFIVRVWDTAAREGLRIDTDGAKATAIFPGAAPSAPGSGASSERFGLGALAAGIQSLAVGGNASAGGVNSTAIGFGAIAEASGVSIGAAAYSGSASVAIGTNTSAVTAASISIGQSHTNTGSVAIGNTNTVTGSRSVALGTLCNVTRAGVLGYCTPDENPVLNLQRWSSTSAVCDLFDLTASWVDSTHAQRKARFTLSANDTATREACRGWADGAVGRFAAAAPASAPTDVHLAASQVSFWVDEVAHNLHFRVKYADGTTLKLGTVALV